jgi:invasion protein IalB
MLWTKLGAMTALVAIFFGLSVLFSGQADAQRVPAKPTTESTGKQAPKVGERIGDWTFQCQALTASDTRCVIFQQLINQKNRRPVLRATLAPLGEKKNLGLIVLAPLGIFLGSGIAGKVDEGKQFKFILQRCTQQGCQAAIQVTDTLKAELQKGKRLVIAFKPTANGKPVQLAVSLNGVAAGLKALKIK